VWQLVNLFASLCDSCDGWAFWFKDRIVYPLVNSEIVAHEDMPANLKADFSEAASIVDLSPRGAAALLRLCLQKLMPHIGGTGDNINEDIKVLVKGGLDVRVQKALDVLRVIGNHAVHPGKIDLKDDKATALRLFEILNVIIVATISTHKKIDALYEKLPASVLEAIEDRDGPKQMEKR